MPDKLNRVLRLWHCYWIVCSARKSHGAIGFLWYLELLAGERISRRCPQILGIDEHFFSRKQGYATTFCDLKNHKVHDVVLGRSEASLENYLDRLEGKHLVQMICMDLAVAYRAIARKHFPQAQIVADRFHVIRTDALLCLCS